MPKVKVESHSKHSPEVTFQKIKGLLGNDQDLRKLDAAYKCEFNDSQLCGTAKGSKFEADMKVSPAAEGSHVLIEVNLPMLLTPIKGMVQTTLQKKLETVLS